MENLPVNQLRLILFGVLCMLVIYPAVVVPAIVNSYPCYQNGTGIHQNIPNCVNNTCIARNVTVSSTRMNCVANVCEIHWLYNPIEGQFYEPTNIATTDESGNSLYGADLSLLNDYYETYHWGFTCTANNQSNPQCDQYCLDKTGPVMECSGTFAYHSVYNDFTFNPSAQCQCKETVFRKVPHFLYQGAWRPIYSRYHDMVCLADINGVIVRTQTPSNTTIEITSDLQINMIIINILTPNIEGTVLVTKDSWAHAQPLDGSRTVIFLPAVVFDISGTLNLKVITSQGTAYEKSFSIIGTSTCIFTDCFLCQAAFDNYSCLPKTYKLGLIFSLLFIILISILMCPVLIYLIALLLKCTTIPVKTSLWFVRNFHKSRLMTKAKGAVRWSFNKTAHLVLPEDGDVESPPQQPRVQKRSNNGKIINKGSYTDTTFFIMCILSLAVTVGSQVCSDGLVIPANSINCVSFNSTTEDCTASYTITATIQTAGLSTCFTLKDEKDNVAFIGTVTYNQMIDRISLSRSYYTGRWYGTGESKHRCNGAGNCNTQTCSTCCNTRNAGGELYMLESTGYPGETICHGSCQCVGCGGCPVCAPSCVYSGYGIIPDAGNLYSVYSLNQRSKRPTVTLALESVTGEKSGASVEYTGYRTDVNGFSLYVVGTFEGDYTEFGTQKVIKSENYANSVWMYSASEPNQPQRGAIGDIQADSLIQLQTPGVNNFRFDKAIVSRVQGTYSDQFTFATCGIDQVGNFLKPFPTVIGGNSWSYTNGELISNITTAPAILYTIETPVGLKFQRVVYKVCPKALFKSASGCYNCLLGFQIIIEASSLCRDGPVTFYTEDPTIHLHTSSIILTTSTKNYTISGTTTKSENDFNLLLYGNGGNFTINVAFTAVFESTVSNDTDYKNNNDGRGGSNPVNWDDIKDSFSNVLPGFLEDLFGSGLPSWKQWLILIGFIIVCIVTFILLIPVFRWAISYSFSSYKSKFDKFRYYKDNFKKKMAERRSSSSRFRQTLRNESTPLSSSKSNIPPQTSLSDLKSKSGNRHASINIAEFIRANGSQKNKTK